jgi:predicted DNA-binding transcriptional regulator AlpA
MTASQTPRPDNGSAQAPSGIGRSQNPGAETTPLGEDQLLTTAEVGLLLRTPSATLRYWRYAGVGPRSFHLGPRGVRYKRSDVLSWLDDQYGAAAQSWNH